MKKGTVPQPPTIVSSPLRGANQDQSGFTPNHDTTDYTISDGVSIAGVGPVAQTPHTMRQKSHTGYTKNAPKLTPADLSKSASYGRMQLDKFARAQTKYQKDQKQKEITRRNTEAQKREKERETNMPKYVKEIVEQYVTKLTWTDQPVAEATKEVSVPTEVQQPISAISVEAKPVADLDEAKRGRPRKNATEEEPEHEHIIMQLRKVVSLRGNYPVTFADGKKSMLSQQSAQRLLNRHNDLKTSIDKDEFAKHIAKSANHLRDTLQGKPIPKEKKQFLPPLKSLGQQ